MLLLSHSTQWKSEIVVWPNRGAEAPGNSHNKSFSGAKCIQLWLPADLSSTVPSHSPPSRFVERTTFHEAVEQTNPASASTSKQKVVQFNLQFRALPTELPFGLSEEEVENCWWAQPDFEYSLNTYSNEVRSYRHKNEEVVRDLLQVVSLCNQACSGSLGDDSMEMAWSLIPMATRGMEADIVPMLKTSRVKHSKTVLGFCKQIPKHLPPALKERMLSSRSMQYSRPHAILARVLGQADASDIN